MTNKLEMWDTSKPDALVIKAAQLLKGGRALDIGAGYGRDALYLARHGFDVTAVDTDSDMLNNLMHSCEEAGISMEIEERDIRDFQSGDTFDLIVCDMVLHFLASTNEVSAVIANLQDLTSPGGANVIMAYTDKNTPGKRPYLFKEHELKNYYDGWQIETYEEKPTPWFQLQGEQEPRRNEAVYLLALKRAD